MKKIILFLVLFSTFTKVFANNYVEFYFSIDGYDDWYSHVIGYTIDTTNKSAYPSRFEVYHYNESSWSCNIDIPENVTYNGVEYPVESIDFSLFDYYIALAYARPIGFLYFNIPSTIKTMRIGEMRDSHIESINISDISAWCDIDIDSYEYDSYEYNLDFSFYLNDTLLTYLVIPEGVDSIKSYAFYRLGHISSVTIPKSVTYVASNAFDGTDWLRNQKGCLYINNMLYKYCGTMPVDTHVDVNNGTTEICEEAFYNCSGLESITMPSSVTKIEDYAFRGCTGLSSITIPSSVTKIGNSAFRDCTALTSITIPSSVCEIGEYAFEDCSSLVSINVDENNLEYTSIDGVLYDKDITTLIRCPERKTSIEIPNTVTIIEHNAFSNCSLLTSIVLPDSVIKIGTSAFRNCKSLNSFVVPNSVVEVGGGVFYGCRALKSVVLSENIKSLRSANSEGFFGYCSSLTTVVIPSDVTEIVHRTFLKCSSLTAISILGPIARIGDFAFSDCSSLTSIVIPNTVTRIGYRVFSDCSSLDTITCFANMPPSADYLDALYKKCLLFVPENSVGDYKSHKEWEKFTNIQGMKEEYIVNVDVNNEDLGEVDGAGTYKHGVKNIITATPNKGYCFVEWNDGVKDNPRVVTVTHDSTFVATFVLEEFALYATSVQPKLGYTEQTIRAVPIQGFEFDCWSDGSRENPRTIIVTEDIHLYAYFKMVPGDATTDIETSRISSLDVYAQDGLLHVDSVKENYYVFDASGRLIYSGMQEILALPRGIYIVTFNGEIQKVVL